MRPTENIEDKVKRMKFSAKSETRERILKDVMVTCDEVNSDTGANRFTIWSLIMESKKVGMAIAAVIAVGVIVGLSQMGGGSNGNEIIAVAGPQDYTLSDGSVVTLKEGAEIKVGGGNGVRGFEHVAGAVTVDVVKGKGEFIVKSVYGDVKALGTIFTVDMLEATDRESGETVSVLAVDVEEGKVEVSNELGKTIIGEGASATMGADSAPYDFRQDSQLPKRLVERIDSMVEAMATGDKRAWCENFNMNALYKLAKGEVKYEDHPKWFAGMGPADAERFVQGLGGVGSVDELLEMMIGSVNEDGNKYYVSSVELDESGKFAKAKAVAYEGENHKVVVSPKWTYFDGDWWQTDD